jgi:hypothetical protein
MHLFMAVRSTVQTGAAQRSGGPRWCGSSESLTGTSGWTISGRIMTVVRVVEVLERAAFEERPLDVGVINIHSAGPAGAAKWPRLYSAEVTRFGWHRVPQRLAAWTRLPGRSSDTIARRSPTTQSTSHPPRGGRHEGVDLGGLAGLVFCG